MAGFMLLSTPIISVFYERGAFNSTSTALTSSALFFYSLGMIGFGINEVMNKAFYALQDGKTPMRASVFGICVNIALSVVSVLFIKTGLEGLAFAASAAANVIGFGLLALLGKRVKNIFTKELFISFAKSVISAIVMSAAVMFFRKEIVISNKYLNLFVPAALGACVYVLMCIILKSEEFFTILKTVLKRFSKEG